MLTSNLVCNHVDFKFWMAENFEDLETGWDPELTSKQEIGTANEIFKNAAREIVSELTGEENNKWQDHWRKVGLFSFPVHETGNSCWI